MVDSEIDNNDCLLIKSTMDSKTHEEKQGWSGTGFAIEKGYIVTNYHVIEGAKTIHIYGVRGDFNTSIDAVVKAVDKINDIALLQLSPNNIRIIIPYAVSASTSEVGEDVFVLGYPLTSTMGDEVKLTTGIISSKTGFQGDVSQYQISAPIQPGNSGGPLFDRKGNVVGIVSAKHRDAENVGYAIKVSYLKNLVETLDTATILPRNNAISAQPLTEQVKKIKNFVYLIKCE